MNWMEKLAMFSLPQLRSLIKNVGQHMSPDSLASRLLQEAAKHRPGTPEAAAITRAAYMLKGRASGLVNSLQGQPRSFHFPNSRYFGQQRLLPRGQAQNLAVAQLQQAGHPLFTPSRSASRYALNNAKNTFGSSPSRKFGPRKRMF